MANSIQGRYGQETKNEQKDKALNNTLLQIMWMYELTNYSMTKTEDKASFSFPIKSMSSTIQNFKR